MPNILKNNRKNVALFGHYGHYNYGDEAIITAVIQNLKKIIPEVNLYCFTLNPIDSEKQHKLPSIPIRRHIYGYIHEASNKELRKKFQSSDSISSKNSIDRIKLILKKFSILVFVVRLFQKSLVILKNIPEEYKFIKESYKILNDFELLIVTGSNQFLDNFGGTSGFPYTLLKWSILCKFTKTKMVFISVGAGPLDKWASKFFVHLAILGNQYLSYRDLNSKKLIEKTIFPINGLIYPDLAHSLNFQSGNHVAIPKIIGINPMPVFDERYWYLVDDSKYKSYLQRMAKFVQELFEREHSVFFFNTMVKDLDVAHDILSLLPKKLNSQIIMKEAHSVNELMYNIDSADIIIPTRFHGAVLSFLAEKPMLGICYYRKTRDIMEEMGQGKYAVDIETFSVDKLLELLEELIQNYSEEKKKINNKNLEYRNRLNDQYLVLSKLVK